MRQTRMDRWIEAAEARRMSLIAQEERAQPPASAPLAESLLTRLRAMVFDPGPDLASRFAPHDAAGRVDSRYT